MNESTRDLLCGTHKTHATWILSTLVGVLTVLTLFGLLPWATRAEVNEFKAETRTTLEQIRMEVNALYRAAGSPPVTARRP